MIFSWENLALVVEGDCKALIINKEKEYSIENERNVDCLISNLRSFVINYLLESKKYT